MQMPQMCFLFQLSPSSSTYLWLDTLQFSSHNHSCNRARDQKWGFLFVQFTCNANKFPPPPSFLFTWKVIFPASKRWSIACETAMQMWNCTNWRVVVEGEGVGGKWKIVANLYLAITFAAAAVLDFHLLEYNIEAFLHRFGCRRRSLRVCTRYCFLIHIRLRLRWSAGEQAPETCCHTELCSQPPPP